jgi:hypothetical protein
MHPHIEENDMQDLINLLEKLASTSQEQFNLVDNLVLSNSDVLPPVALTQLPIVRYIYYTTHKDFYHIFQKDVYCSTVLHRGPVRSISY